MNSKDKGNIGEALAIAKFVELGIQVSIPFGDNARYDLIADFNGKLNKIQVKYCNCLSENDSLSCRCCSSTYHTKYGANHSYKDDVDYMCFYLAPWNEIVLIPIEDIGNRKTIQIRKNLPKNNQSNVTLYSDYLFEKTLCVETLHDEPTE